jgi:hypothetical protein
MGELTDMRNIKELLNIIPKTQQISPENKVSLGITLSRLEGPYMLYNGLLIT